MSNSVKRQGGCLCGAVRYEGNGEWQQGTACHCSQCRRQSGGYYMATGIASDDFNLTRDKGLCWYGGSDHAERGFCKACGSVLFWRSLDENWASTRFIGILLGSLDNPQGLHITKHIFVTDKGEYYDIADGLPQYQQVET